MGGIDTSHFTGELKWNAVLSPLRFWQIGLDSVELGSQPLVASSLKAIVDSGTSFLTFPSNVAMEIAQSLGAIRVFGGKYVLPSCDSIPLLPDLTFTINDIAYSLTSKDYTMQLGKVCLVAMMDLDVPEPIGATVILGDVFMRKFYTVFDAGNSKIGIATAVHNTSCSFVI